MNYIIEPSWFYWLSVVEGIRVVMMVGIVLTAICLFIATVSYFSSMDWGDNEAAKRAKRFIKPCIIVLIILAFVVVFVPSKDTMIEMQVAKFATYENAQWTVDSIKSVVDYIVEAIKGMK